jgi:iron complex outermembrane receptor protein
MFQVHRRTWSLVLPFVLYALPALAQPTGTISGTVRDASGAGVPGATLTATNQATSATLTAVSSADGGYSVHVAPGVYSVTVSLKGFGRQTRRDLKVEAGAAVAADFSLEPRREEEITITALKRESTVHETPFSVAAPTEENLRARGVDDLEGVARNVAGFSVQNLGPGQSQVAIRGVSSGQVARDQPGPKEEVGSYLDESVISLLLFTPDIDLFDVSRVEVLRGPQGTLFGSGSLSGTVRYITNRPELGVSKSFGEFAGSTIDGGNQGGNVKLGFNVPLGRSAALRAVAYHDQFAGYMGAVQPDLSVKENVNTGERTGGRVALELVPTEKLTVTPRFVYQKVKGDGWNRIDSYNILGNPFTTTRPAVRLGDRQLFTQVDEPYTDDFLLADVNVRYNFGEILLTSITSYTHRDILVVRDAGALTSSITGGSFGLPETVYSLNAPLDDATTAEAWTEELRLSGGKDRFQWVAGGFYSDAKKAYGQNLVVGGYEALVPTGPSNTRTVAPKDSLFFSDLDYKTRQFAFFGEGTLAVSDRFRFTAGLRYYDFKDDKEQIFDGLFGAGADGKPQSTPGTTAANGVAPRFIASYQVSASTNLNAQASKGFRLGGINDPLNVNLCTPSDLVTFGGQAGFKDETAWNYEIGSKSRVLGGRGSFNVSAFYVDITDLQVVVTAGSCSSRLVYSVPQARSSGGEVEFEAALNDNFDLAISAGFNDSTLRSTVTSTAPDGTVSVVSGIVSGRRLPSVAEFQMAAAATYQWHVGRSSLGYVTGTYQHVGSRYTQVGDEDLGTLDLLSFAPTTIGGPLTQATFKYDPLLPAYDIVNLRFGVRYGHWDVAFYVNNLTDERAFLALDRERGTRARIGYLTNQPRTFGINARVDF